MDGLAFVVALVAGGILGYVVGFRRGAEQGIVAGRLIERAFRSDGHG